MQNIEYIPAPPTRRQEIIKKSQETLYIALGRILIQKKRLQKNSLLTMAPSGGPTLLGKARQISDPLKNILVDLLQTQKIDIEMQKALRPDDAKIFAAIIRYSKLTKILGYKPHVLTIADHVRRYDVLRGGLLAGNHAPEILNELRDLTTLLSTPALGIISPEKSVWIFQLLRDLEAESV